MLSEETSFITQYVGGIAASLFACIFLLQKFFNSWKSDSAENSIITLMHSELERMSEQNTKLSVELGKLQQELIELNNELRALTVENQQLHSEVVALNQQVASLQGMLRGERI